MSIKTHFVPIEVYERVEKILQEVVPFGKVDIGDTGSDFDLQRSATQELEAIIHEYGAYFSSDGQTMKVLPCNGLIYWCEGNRLKVRLVEGDCSAYDTVADKYDTEFSEWQSIGEYINQTYIGFVPNQRVLDIGCGTARFVEHYKSCIRYYEGVEPSLKMLEHAEERLRCHCQTKVASYRMVCSGFESYYPVYCRQFDLAISLFGSASYISREALVHKLPKLAQKWVLMFYKEGYQPASHKLAQTTDEDEQPEGKAESGETETDAQTKPPEPNAEGEGTQADTKTEQSQSNAKNREAEAKQNFGASFYSEEAIRTLADRLKSALYRHEDFWIVAGGVS